jgi:hypothetical protein
MAIASPPPGAEWAGSDAQPSTRFRVRAAPPLDPPFDEAVGRPPGGMDMLPFSSPFLARTPHGRRRPCSHRPMRRPDPTKGRETVPPPEQEGGCSGRAAARRFVGICVEVINGFRPVAHLRRLAAPQRFADVADQVLRRTARLRKAQHSRQPVRVRRIHLTEPTTGVVEAAVVLDHSGRCWAMAIRLERGPDGWQCTVIQVI